MAKTGITKYYAGGKLISPQDKELYASGAANMVICSPKDQPGHPFAMKAGSFQKWEQNIDPDDPIVKEVTGILGLKLEETFIIENHVDGESFATIYGFFSKGDL